MPRGALLLCLLLGACVAPRPAPARAQAPVVDAPRAASASATATPAPLPPPPKKPDRLLYAHGEPIRGSAIQRSVDPSEAKRVRTALFKRSLSDLADCPKVGFFEPKTWVEVDNLQELNVRAGRFVAVVEERIEGSFTEPDQHERLFVVRIENCQNNSSGTSELAIFPETLDRPLLRWTERPLLSNDDMTFVAVMQRPHEPARLLATGARGYRVVELNRPFVRGAAFRTSTNVFTLDGKPAIEPWTLVAEGTLPPPAECRGFFDAGTSPPTVRLEIRPGPCPAY